MRVLRSIDKPASAAERVSKLRFRTRQSETPRAEERPGRNDERLLEPDRFSLKQQGSRFFGKKRRKKLLFAWARGNETSTAQNNKVFLLLFAHKKKPSSFLDMTCPKTIRL
jgi:hypothetical protein